MACGSLFAITSDGDNSFVEDYFSSEWRFLLQFELVSAIFLRTEMHKFSIVWESGLNDLKKC